MKKIIVTGATGFVGSHMVAFLKEKGHYVKAIGTANKNHAYRKRWYEKADVIEAVDLRNLNETIHALKGFDFVYHFAADMGGVGYFSQAQYIPFMNNMRIDLNMIEGSIKAGVKRLYYASTACIYPIDIQGKEGETPYLNEKMLIPANADQMYGWEKLMLTLLSSHSPLDIRVGIMNTIFGEGQEGVGKRAKFPPSIVHKVIHAKKTGKPIEIWGNGKQTRTFLYIEDAIRKIHAVMNRGKNVGPVNIAADEIVTIQQCADWLCEIAGITPAYTYLLDKPSGVLARGIDNKKFYENFGYKNKFTTKEGFKRLYDFMIKYGSL